MIYAVSPPGLLDVLDVLTTEGQAGTMVHHHEPTREVGRYVRVLSKTSGGTNQDFAAPLGSVIIVTVLLVELVAGAPGGEDTARRLRLRLKRRDLHAARGDDAN